MPSRTQIVPEHEYPHVMVVEHDNSQRPNDRATNVLQTYADMLFVFASPKGIDREIQSIQTGYPGFIEHYGIGTFDDFGQPYLNALNAASTNAATLHCLRVTAEDATYAGGALVAHYKVKPKKEPEVPPEPPVESEYVDTMGHANVVASDEIDEATGAVTIKVAGTDLTPGISAENAELFGAVTGNFIDITLDIATLASLDPEKQYKVTQTNPALMPYAGTDPYVTNENGAFVKTKTYKGADLMDGYAILLGSGNATIRVVEFDIVEKEPVVEIYVENDTDFSVALSDPKAHITVTHDNDKPAGTQSAAIINLSGEIVPGMINPELWGDIDMSDKTEVDIVFPGIDPDAKYTIVQTNPVLANYSTDPFVSSDNAGSETIWRKVKTYTGNQFDTGYAILKKKDELAVVSLFPEGADTGNDAPIAYAVVINDETLTWVKEHAPAPEPQPEEIGKPTTITVESALAFGSTDTAAANLKATAFVNRMTRKAAAKIAEETPPVEEDLNGKMDIYYTFEPLEGPVTDKTDLGSFCEVSTAVDEDGYTAVKMFEIVSRWRGLSGNNIRFVFTNYARGDKQSAYKNYALSVYEIDKATLVKKAEHIVSLRPEAVTADGNTLYMDYLIGDPWQNSEYIETWTNPYAMDELFAAYLQANPETPLTKETFDPLTGHVFGNSLTEIPFLSIDAVGSGKVAVSGASGIALTGGDDGAFTIGRTGRSEALIAAYLKAYSGEMDRNIFSRKLFPTDIILDANFPIEVKAAMTELVHTRKDTMAFYDLGTEFNTFEGMMEELADLEPYATSRDESVEAYYGKIQDPVTFKIVKVSSTYPLASMYPLHFQANGAKHVPLAGSSYGRITGFIRKSAFPVYDDDIDQITLDKLVDARVNYLKVNSLKQVVRATQTTRQDADTNLSECSNVFILHDIRRDAIMLCEQYEYNFAEASDLQRFNKAATILADKYAAAQVKTITAVFDMNDWETERGILHLYIEFIHKDIIKRAIVEIDINRGKVVV